MGGATARERTCEGKKRKTEEREKQKERRAREGERRENEREEERVPLVVLSTRILRASFPPLLRFACMRTGNTAASCVSCSST